MPPPITKPPAFSFSRLLQAPPKKSEAHQPAADSSDSGGGKKKQKKRKRQAAAPEAAAAAARPGGSPVINKLGRARPAGSAARSAGLPEHRFEADYGDHFETPLAAYQDVLPMLEALAGQLGKPAGELRLWDPFYCTGSCKRHLRTLGFGSVHNRNEDFYVVAGLSRPEPSGALPGGAAGVRKGLLPGAEASVPEHDVLITNPPYSIDHKERVLEYCAKSGKPWLLLLPNYVASKSYFKQSSDGVFFLVPSDKYEYEHPEGTGHATSPFFSIWYCWFPPAHKPAAVRAGAGRAGGKVLRSVGELQSQGAAPTGKRLNPKQRKKRRAMAGA